MANDYSTGNPPALISQGIGGLAGTRTWVNVDDCATASFDAAGFISNGDDLGMKVGDTVILVDNTTPATTLVHGHVVNTVTAGGAVNVSQGVALSTGGTSGD